MMIGNVNSRREAIIQFAVLGENNQRQAIKAVIDTGYTGFLTLLFAIIVSNDRRLYSLRYTMIAVNSSVLHLVRGDRI